MFLKLSKAFVRPYLEYANAVCHPTKMKDIIPSLKNLSYGERLQN